ncbi:hypothetical protein ACIA49_38620 [Kribbella sp. NPDC051587]|uniref:hypothetical protein n=1 Tax=Kribbella sp. NPDC051587 TaxID=3364119 RepID=UPI00379D5697
MGKRNRRKGERPKRRVVPGMAEDDPLIADPNSRAYILRAIRWSARAQMFLLNYLSYADDGGFSVPGHGAPREDGETDEQYELRRDVTRGLVEVQAALGSWAELAAEDLRQIMPSDAGHVAGLIFSAGIRWGTATNFEAAPNDLRDGARPYLDAMCPEHHRDDAEQVLTGLMTELTLGLMTGIVATEDDDPIERSAGAQPIATIHVVAAITTWLYQQPACVPDRPAVLQELNDDVMKALPYL